MQRWWARSRGKMEIVDLRGSARPKERKILVAGGGMVYYTERAELEGRSCLFLLCRAMPGGAEKTLFALPLGRSGVHARVFLLGSPQLPEGALVIAETGEEEITLFHFAGATFRPGEPYRIGCAGRFEDAFLLDGGHCLLFFSGSERFEELYGRMKRATGAPRSVFLLDLTSGATALVRNIHPARAGARGLCRLCRGQKEWLFLMESPAGEAEKRYFYETQRALWLGRSEVLDALSVAEIPALVSAASRGTPDLPLRAVRRAGIDGAVRFLGAHEGTAYYRAASFISGVHRLIAFDCEMQEEQILWEEENSGEEALLVDGPDARGYRVIKRGEQAELIGVFNSALRCRLPEGEPVAVCEDRYILLVCARPQNVVAVYDAQEESLNRFEAHFALEGGGLFLL